MEIIEKLIEKEYQSAFRKDKIHILLSDMEKLKSLDTRTNNCNNSLCNTNCNIYDKSYTIMNTLQYKKEFTKIASNKLLKNLFTEIKTKDSWLDVRELLDLLNELLLPSTVKNLNKYITFMNKDKNSETINVFIVGGGPIGLFTACYLHFTYNVYRNFKVTFPKINILIIDNRIKTDSIRNPYSRVRYFACFSEYLSLLYSRFNCWTAYYNDSIKYLENLLYLYIFNNDIPIYFTDKFQNWNIIKKIIKKGKIDIVFDCTGGRLQHNTISELDITNWMITSNIKLENKLYKIVINKKKNNATLIWKKNNIYKSYLDIQYFDKNKNNIYSFNKEHIISHTMMLSNNKNYKTASVNNNKYMSFKSFIKFINNLENNFEVKELKETLKSNNFHNYIESISYVKISIINTNITHALKISKTFIHNNHKCIYIGLGETIFKGHFVIGAGLQRVMDITTKICNLLPIINANKNM
jgi:hypothetical protein